MDYWATAMPVTAHAQDPPQPKGVGFYRVKENGKGVLLLCQEALPLTRCWLQALFNLLDPARPPSVGVDLQLSSSIWYDSLLWER